MTLYLSVRLFPALFPFNVRFEFDKFKPVEQRSQERDTGNTYKRVLVNLISLFLPFFGIFSISSFFWDKVIQCDSCWWSDYSG